MYLHPKHITGGNTIVKQVGTKEDSLITLPRLRIEGLWYGSPTLSSPTPLIWVAADNQVPRQGLLFRQVAHLRG